MPPPIKKMGRAKAPGFVDNLSNASPVKKSTLPILVLIVLAGAGVIWFFYSRSQNAANTAGSSTGSAVTVGAGASGSGSDQSDIDNLTQSVLAMAGQVTNNSSTPSGGTSTPITTVTSVTTPATTTPSTAGVTIPAGSYVSNGSGPSTATGTTNWASRILSGMSASDQAAITAAKPSNVSTDWWNNTVAFFSQQGYGQINPQQGIATAKTEAAKVS